MLSFPQIASSGSDVKFAEIKANPSDPIASLKSWHRRKRSFPTEAALLPNLIVPTVSPGPVEAVKERKIAPPLPPPLLHEKSVSLLVVTLNVLAVVPLTLIAPPLSLPAAPH
jgi:hypothetical protein